MQVSNRRNQLHKKDETSGQNFANRRRPKHDKNEESRQNKSMADHLRASAQGSERRGKQGTHMKKIVKETGKQWNTREQGERLNRSSLPHIKCKKSSAVLAE